MSSSVVRGDMSSSVVRGDMSSSVVRGDMSSSVVNKVRNRKSEDVEGNRVLLLAIFCHEAGVDRNVTHINSVRLFVRLKSTNSLRNDTWPVLRSIKSCKIHNPATSRFVY